VKWEQVCALARDLPEVAEGTSYRTPALKVRGKGFVRLKEDGKSIVFLLASVDEQELLCETRPDLYFITDHYRGWPAVLARLSALRTAECRFQLERAWRVKAPKVLVKQRDAKAQDSGARRAR
jgi:hypothetical protein